MRLQNRREFERIKALKHELNGRTLDLNIGCKKSEVPAEVHQVIKRKVFVSGVPSSTSDGEFYQILVFLGP